MPWVREVNAFDPPALAVEMYNLHEGFSSGQPRMVMRGLQYPHLPGLLR